MRGDWEHRKGDPKWKGGDRWQAVVTVPGTGGRGQRSANFRANGITAARKKHDDVKKRLRGEIAEDQRYSSTVAAIIDRWLDLKRRSWEQTTLYNATIMLDRIRLELGHHRAADLTALHLDDWYGLLLDEGLSPSTVGHFHALIHAMLKQAHKWGMVPGNIADLASPPARSKKTKSHDTPTADALRALIAAAPPDLLLAARVAAGLGIRRGEVVGLRWSDIDGAEITVQRAMFKVPGKDAAYKSTKTDDVRRLDLDDDLVTMLETHKVNQDALFAAMGKPVPTDCPIFLNWRGATAPHPRPPDWITKAWTKLCAAHGVKVRFHALRHFTATQLLGSGHSLATVAEQLGHANPAVTAKVYAHALPRASVATAKTMGDVLRPRHDSNVRPSA